MNAARQFILSMTGHNRPQRTAFTSAARALNDPDGLGGATIGVELPALLNQRGGDAVSYTHLDVYKRQILEDENLTSTTFRAGLLVWHASARIVSSQGSLQLERDQPSSGVPTRQGFLDDTLNQRATAGTRYRRSSR